MITEQYVSLEILQKCTNPVFLTRVRKTSMSKYPIYFVINDPILEIQTKQQWTESRSYIDGFDKAFDGFNHNLLPE